MILVDNGESEELGLIILQLSSTAAHCETHFKRHTFAGEQQPHLAHSKKASG